MKKLVEMLVRFLTVLVTALSLSTAEAAPAAKMNPGDMVLTLSTQLLEVYGDDGNVAWTIPVMTGAEGMRTPPGVYTIKNHVSNVTFAGGYKSRWWLGIDIYPGTKKTFGLHDASWWSDDQFLDAARLNKIGDGSHGCVNIPPAWMELLYKAIKSVQKNGKQANKIYIRK